MLYLYNESRGEKVQFRFYLCKLNFIPTVVVQALNPSDRLYFANLKSISLNTATFSLKYLKRAIPATDMRFIRTISFTAERTVIPARESISVTAVDEKLEPIRTMSSEPSTCQYVPNETANMDSAINLI